MKRKKKKPGDKSPRSSLAGFYSPAKREFLQRDPSGLDVGERIRRERYLKSFTMDQMAGYLGISTSYLGAMERGARPVSKHMMHVLHDRLGLSYDYLWEGLSVTGTMISQYVHESNQYEQPIKHKIDVLINVASDLQKMFRNTDVLSRLGGDEFIVYMRDVPEMEWARQRAENVVRVVRRWVGDGTTNIQVTASVGVVMTDNVERVYEELYRAADIAMYFAKAEGGNQAVFYSRDLLAQARGNATTRVEAQGRENAAPENGDLR